MARDDAERDDLDALDTERANPRTRDLDRLDTAGMLEAMNAEDATVAAAVGAVIPTLALLVDRVADRLRAGGRLHYFGAGTSGRLGVLDASECPPTFGVSADLITGHMAGGPAALVTAVEGAEDDERQGEADGAAVLTARDAAVVLTASGRTPWCLGVLRAAATAGALRAAITCNRPTPVHAAAEIVVDPLVGEEVLAGSTRLKAGTAQKLVLNMLSTGVMVRLGRTFGNLMVGVVAGNEKLRARALRLVREITGRHGGAEAALRAAGWDVRRASVMLLLGVDAAEAAARIERAGGSLRRALESP